MLDLSALKVARIPVLAVYALIASLKFVISDAPVVAPTLIVAEIACAVVFLPYRLKERHDLLLHQNYLLAF